jgi:hypothetical protein
MHETWIDMEIENLTWHVLGRLKNFSELHLLVLIKIN